MTATYAVFAVLVAVVAVLVWRETRRDPVCRFNGCRRVATVTVPYAHPAGRMLIRLCSGHAYLWDAAPFDQELAPGTDLGKWDRQVEG